MTRDASAYLDRIRWSGDVTHDLATLASLQLTHLQAVPFEALDVFAGRRVATTDDWAWDKVVQQRRGGWCFEANGAFALLLESLGFEVKRLGAAVLLGGPATLVDHLVLEVVLDEPWLVEVGFGDQAPITPLPLNRAGPIETPAGTFEFLASPHGTTLTQHVGGVPEARYRFKRTNHALAEFAPASERLQDDPEAHWSTSPFATRVDGPDHRLTLTRAKLKRQTHDGTIVEETLVEPADWNQTLTEEFGVVADIDPGSLRKSG